MRAAQVTGSRPGSAFALTPCCPVLGSGGKAGHAAAAESRLMEGRALLTTWGLGTLTAPPCPVSASALSPYFPAPQTAQTRHSSHRDGLGSCLPLTGSATKSTRLGQLGQLTSEFSE